LTNPKSENRNPKQIQNLKSQNAVGAWDFELVSDFEFRISSIFSA